MSEKPEMKEHEEWEMRVQKTSRQFEFPQTPKISEQVQRQLHPRPLVWRPAALILLLLMILLFAVPQIRASVLELLKIGAGNFITIASPTAFPSLDLPLLPSGIEMSLEEAEAAVNTPIPLPTELGNPSVVYLQEGRLRVLVLVWYEPEAFDTPRILLYIFDSRDTFFKFIPNEPEAVFVNGQLGAWFSNPHLMEFGENANGTLRRAIEGNVLVWEAANKTYRLEGDLTQEEALRIAESLP